MTSEETKQLIQEIKQRSLVEYLSSLGYEPKLPIKGNNYWYLSPLRTERTASFKVDAAKNCWYDHGIGKGGNLLDFALAYYQLETVGEFLSMIRNNNTFSRIPVLSNQNTHENSPILKVIDAKPLTNFALLNYLRNRRIDLDVACYFCKEVAFTIGEKNYYGIGFQNDSGGWEIRNRFMKCCCAPKTNTIIKNNHSKVNVFEGFFNFLSHMSIHKHLPEFKEDYIILNGLAMVSHAKPVIESYREGNLFLDWGTGGNHVTEELTTQFPYLRDQRTLYQNYGDYNDWLCKFGQPKPQRVALRR